MFKKWWPWISIGLVVIGSLLFLLGNRRTFHLQVDGSLMQVQSSAISTGGVLHSAGIEYSADDRLQPAAFSLANSRTLIKLDHLQDIDLIINPGNTQLKVTSTERIPGNLALAAGILLFPKDSILQNGLVIDAKTPIIAGSGTTLQIRKAFPITINEQGASTTFYSSSPTLIETLLEQGFTLTKADQPSLPWDTPITGALSIDLLRARDIVISTSDQQIKISAAGPTIGEALAQAGYPLQNLDYSIPGENELLPVDGNIRIVRVSEKVALSQSFIPYTTKYIEDPETELDRRSVVTAGQYGIKAERTRTLYEDGVEVSQDIDAEWTVQEPVAEQLGYGTKVEIRTMDTPNGPIEYWRAVNVYVTSYSPCRSGVSQCLNGTSSGMPVSQGTIGVTRAWYSWMVGQKLYVPGYGVGVVGDIGGGFPDRYWIDLAYTDDAYVPWSQYVTIYFLTPVPPSIPWILP
jgi:uncharacterized protein YabE (DUF348 family)